MYLKLYIDFSNKYQKIVKNKLNYDVKMIIWDKYKHIYFYEKLISYIEKCIFKCDDCQTARWNIRLGRNRIFMKSKHVTIMVIYTTTIAVVKLFV